MNISKTDRKKTAFLRSKDGVFFRKNEELVVLKRSLSSQKTSFSSEKTPFFIRGNLLIILKVTFHTKITSKHEKISPIHSFHTLIILPRKWNDIYLNLVNQIIIQHFDKEKWLEVCPYIRPRNEPDFNLQIQLTNQTFVGVAKSERESIRNKSKVELFPRSAVAGYRRLLYPVQCFRK